MSDNELTRLFQLAGNTPIADLQAGGKRPGLLTRYFVHRQAEAAQKAIGEQLISLAHQQPDAKRQDAVTNVTFEMFGLYDSASGIREPTGATFELLRRFAQSCEPLAAIINTIVTMCAEYASIPEITDGQVRVPGFHIRMMDEEAEPTDEQKIEMKKWEQFFLDGGFCDPPEDEVPEHFERGLHPFIQEFIRDSFTLDWAVARTWASADGQYPVACFAAQDAGKFRLKRKDVKGMTSDGRLLTEEFKDERTNAKGPIRYKKMTTNDMGGMATQSFTRDEVFHMIRNPRTDEKANGYGYCESEQAIEMIQGWMFGRAYNSTRFRKDTLPRGILSIMGQLDKTQFEMFKLEWKQMLQGLGGRWGIPIVRGLPQTGASLAWQPFDLSSRDMEYHQWMHLMAVVMHAIYKIHPEETGFDALSPLRPPLNEGSPDVKLEYSQDKSLHPALKKLQDVLNKKILWRNVPDKWCMFEFVGVNQTDEQQDVEVATARLAGGLSTPRMEWARRDQKIPEATKDHPAWDIPAPWMEGAQYCDAQVQAEIAQQQATQQQQIEQQNAAMQSGAPGMPQAPQGGSQVPQQAFPQQAFPQQGPPGQGSPQDMMQQGAPMGGEQFGKSVMVAIKL